jgi:hypothetical protein
VGARPNESVSPIIKRVPTLRGRQSGIGEMMQAHGHEDQIDRA